MLTRIYTNPNFHGVITDCDVIEIDGEVRFLLRGRTRNYLKDTYLPQLESSQILSDLIYTAPKNFGNLHQLTLIDFAWPRRTIGTFVIRAANEDGNEFLVTADQLKTIIYARDVSTQEAE